MAIAANWHFTDTLPGVERQAEYDPFSDPSYAPPLSPISITTDGAALTEALDSLLAQEASLFERGVECPIKDLPDTTCLACPVSAERDFSEPKGQLCRVGQEQERVATVMVAQSRGLTA